MLDQYHVTIHKPIGALHLCRVTYKQAGGGAKYINVYPLHEKAKIYIYINIH